MLGAPARKASANGAKKQQWHVAGLASDWNPGSAPMGDLLVQAAVMSAAEKLSTAEVLAALTVKSSASITTERCRPAAGRLRR